MIPTRFAWERALRADETVPWHLKSVLLLLATYMSNDGSEARPSVPTLARQSGLSRARVFELLRQAGERGWVQSVSAPGKVTVRLPQIPDPSCPPDGSGSTTRPTHGTG